MVKFEFSKDLARERRFLSRAASMVGCGYLLCVSALHRSPTGELTTHQIVVDYLGLMCCITVVLALPCAAIAARVRDAGGWAALALVISPLLVRALC